MRRGFASSLRLAVLAALPWPAALRAAPEPPPEPPAYEDRLIEGGKLAPIADDSAGVSYDESGMPRAWRVEAFASRNEQGATIRHESGLLLSARLETLQYGAFTLDASLRANPGSTLVTLWQRDMAFDGGWRASNGLGNMNTPAIDLARQQYRFYLPSFPFAGAQTEWTRLGRLQLQASVGEPGIFDGLRIAGFSRLGGTLATAGAQWNPDAHWQAGVQFASAHGVGSGLGTPDATSTDARSMYAAIAWRDTDHRLQANVLDSELNAGRHNTGVWLEGESRDGRYRHNYGIFRFDPNLSWAYSPVSGDLQGAYYRVNYASQQWLWSGGMDSVAPVTDRGPTALYGTASLRYQANTTLGVGGGASWRRSGNDTTAVYGFVDKTTFLGTSRVQVDLVDAGALQSAQQLTFDQAWPTRVGLRLSTSLSAGHESTPESRIRRASFATLGGIDVTSTLSIDGNLRWANDRGTTRTVGRYANVGLAWRISPRWSLAATYYDNRSDTRDFLAVAPVVPVEAAAIVPRDRALFVTLRYEDRAGTPVAPLGGPPGAGAGTLEGAIYYDANDDGRRNASEAGAANVTVILDGRFSVRTDSTGAFSFPFVAAGPHTVVVLPDNLALPYAIPGEGRVSTLVRTRETTRIEIAATRVR